MVPNGEAIQNEEIFDRIPNPPDNIVMEPNNAPTQPRHSDRRKAVKPPCNQPFCKTTVREGGFDGGNLHNNTEAVVGPSDFFIKEPSTPTEALNGPYSTEWLIAIANEINNMKINNVWEVMPKPSG